LKAATQKFGDFQQPEISLCDIDQNKKKLTQVVEKLIASVKKWLFIQVYS